jgi:ABC-type sugar transport system ATPase subunit
MQQEVYRLIREAQAAGATVFFSSHIISEVGAIAQRLAIIRGGVIVEEGVCCAIDYCRLVSLSPARHSCRWRTWMGDGPAACPDIQASNGIKKTF